MKHLETNNILNNDYENEKPQYMPLLWWNLDSVLLKGIDFL